jgi:Ca2+-binding RTX toxin-like protein
LEGGDNSEALRALTNSLTGGGDTAVYSEAKTGVTVNLATGGSRGEADATGGSRGEADGDRFFNIENILGSAYGDILIGDSGNNDINPGLMLNGTDDINGGDGTDRLTVNYSLSDYGTVGVFGGLGYGYLNRDDSDPNLASKVVFDAIERLYIIGTSQNDSLFGGNLGDVFLTGAGDDTIDGGAGDDFINADDGTDNLIGGLGNDLLLGGAGNDTIDGGAGDDILKGTNGGSSLEIDTLTGGLGKDVFVLADGQSGFYQTGQNKDYAIITDFNPDEGDSLQLNIRLAYDFVDIMPELGFKDPTVAIYSKNSAYATSDRDLVAIVQSVPGSARLRTRSNEGFGSSIPERTLGNPFIWVGEPFPPALIK